MMGGFVSLLVANFFFFLCFSQLMLLPKFFVSLGLDPAGVGLVMGTFSVTVLVCLPLVGWLAERIPRRRLFVFGAVLMAAATAAFALVQTPGWPLWCLRIVQGVAFASAFGVSGALVFDVAIPGRRAYLLGVLSAANISTHALGPCIGELLILHTGYRVYFLVAALFGIVGAAAGCALPSGAVDARRSRMVMHDSWGPALGGMILGLVFGVQVIFLPPYLQECGMVNSSPFFLAFVAGSLLVWGLLHRFLSRISPRVGRWLAVGLLLPLALLPVEHWMVLVVSALLFGIGYGWLYPVLNALMLTRASNHTGSANALFVWAFNAGMLCASFAGGWLSSCLGYDRALALVGLCCLLLLLLPVDGPEGEGA